ncbi:MAG: hypothetical protein CR992_00160 [Desulfobacterales bacterium]|nr:MAG: hypothetical protein CR992_00160 [Desulfobacterales bacterium]
MGKRRDSSDRAGEKFESMEASRNEFINLVNELFDHFEREVVLGRFATKPSPGRDVKILLFLRFLKFSERDCCTRQGMVRFPEQLW